MLYYCFNECILNMDFKNFNNKNINNKPGLIYAFKIIFTCLHTFLCKLCWQALLFLHSNKASYKYIHSRGPRKWGWAPIKLGIYRAKISKIRKISFFLLFGLPLDKIHSAGPVYILHQLFEFGEFKKIL